MKHHQGAGLYVCQTVLPVPTARDHPRRRREIVPAFLCRVRDSVPVRPENSAGVSQAMTPDDLSEPVGASGAVFELTRQTVPGSGHRDRARSSQRNPPDHARSSQQTPRNRARSSQRSGRNSDHLMRRPARGQASSCGQVSSRAFSSLISIPFHSSTFQKSGRVPTQQEGFPPSREEGFPPVREGKGGRGQPRPFCPRSAGMSLIGQNGLAFLARAAPLTTLGRWASLASHNAESISFS